MELELDDENFVVTEEQLEEIERRMREDAVHNVDKSHGVFADAGKDALKALLLFYLNSGCGRFSEWKHFSKAHEGLPLDIDELSEELSNEALSEEELSKMLEKFGSEHNYVPDALHACCACGIRSYEEKFECVPLNNPNVDKFKYTPEDRDQLEVRLGYGNTTKIYTGPTETNGLIRGEQSPFTKAGAASITIFILSWSEQQTKNWCCCARTVTSTGRTKMATPICRKDPLLLVWILDRITVLVWYRQICKSKQYFHLFGCTSRSTRYLPTNMGG